MAHSICCFPGGILNIRYRASDDSVVARVALEFDRASANGSGESLAPNQAPIFTAPVFSIQRISNTGAGEDWVSNLSTSGRPTNPTGSQIVFYTSAALLPGDTNGLNDVYIRDLVTGTLTRVSTKANGGQTSTGWGSHDPEFSSDGTKILFESGATDLVVGDTNNNNDLFIKSLGAGTLVRLTDASGAQMDNAFEGALSPDGTKVAFTSSDPNLVAGDANARLDVFVKDLLTGAITRVSVGSTNIQGFGESRRPVFSPDGTKVLFESLAVFAGTEGNPRGWNLYLKDLVTGALTLVSSSSAGDPAIGNANLTYLGSFSPDGTKVIFTSSASNLVAGDSSGGPDVFIKDLLTGAITRVSSDENGGQLYQAYGGRFSPDGQQIVFDGSVHHDTGINLWVKDLASGSMINVAQSATGQLGYNGSSGNGHFTPDGKGILFDSSAFGLVPQGPGGVMLATIGSVTPTFMEGYSRVPIVESVTLKDDNANFAGGTLTIAITQGARDGDLVELGTPGTGASVHVVGTDVTYNGVVIGVLSVLGATWSIALNQHADVEAVKAIAEAAYFSNPTNHPGNGTRTVTFTLVDGGGVAGGGSDTAQFTRTIITTDFNQAPSGANTAAMLFEDSVHVFTLADFGFSDPDLNEFLGARIWGDMAQGGKVLLDRDGAGGSAPVEVTYATLVSASDIALGYLTFVSTANYHGTGWVPFRVLDNGDPGPDGVSNLSDQFSFTPTILSVNDRPTFSIEQQAAGNYIENAPGLALSGPVTVDDVDSTNFIGGTLTVVLTNGEATDRLDIFSGNAMSGGVTVVGDQIYSGFYAVGTIITAEPHKLIIALANESVDAGVKALAEAIRFSSTSEDPSSGARTVTYTLVDGGGTANGGVDTASFSRTVTVTSVDDPAVASADAFVTTESTVRSGNLFANNGFGVDHDVDGPVLSVSAVNGSTALVGKTFTLASGAQLAVRADGSFDYDPHGAFAALPYSSSGAANPTMAQDSFTYSLATGGTATVTFTVTGLDTNDLIMGTMIGDTLNGGAGDDIVDGLQGDDSITGGSGRDALAGGAGNDLLDGGADIDTANYALSAGPVTVSLAVTGEQDTGGAGTDTLSNIENLIGSGYSDTLTGNGGANRIDGGAGADAMAGGGGNDIYVVDNTDDVVTETAGGGTDTVEAAVSYVLVATLENLKLTGASAINGTGNALGNVISGNEAANILVGGDGNDQLNGEGGDDQLDGGIGKDRLNGGLGADKMAGGDGDDIYLVDDANDTLLENAGQGIDRVESAIGWTLGANFENLSLLGTAAVNATGNALDNSLVGNGAANRLDGGAGADAMAGGAGGDTYVVDNAGDVVTELAGGGTDTVETQRNYVLGANLENLTLTGLAAVNGTGNALANVILGNGAANILAGADGDDRLSGDLGNDTLDGGAGKDRLDGGVGADKMTGGLGDDVFVVDSIGDKIFENAGEGIDSIESAIAFSLVGLEVENLTLTGTAAISATGNGYANKLVGNDAANTLDGGAGADTMTGGGGNDRYVVDSIGDKVVELAGGGTDSVLSSISFTLGAEVENLALTGTAAINATGNAAANALTGNAAANTLDGKAGADTMTGGAGNDRYFVDDAGDRVYELADGGVDTVTSSVSYALVANIESLTLSGTAAINATGNTLDNVLVGNAGANILNGAAGADSMTGGAGDDTYVVDNAGDKAIEAAGGGNDTVQSAITYTLGANIENLTLTGSAAINGTGNSVANTLVGNALANVLDGGAGADRMEGGTGRDTYIVDNLGDTIVELAGGGVDTAILKLASGGVFALAAEVENMEVGGSSTEAHGNALANTIVNTGVGNNLFGEGGNDVMSGGAYAETFHGGAGNDTITGGGGRDTLWGDDGSDRFVFATGSGVDEVVDFTRGADKIDLAGYGITGFSQLQGMISQSDSDALINLGGGNTITLDDIVASQLTASDFVFAAQAPAAMIATNALLSDGGAASVFVIDF